MDLTDFGKGRRMAGCLVTALGLALTALAIQSASGGLPWIRIRHADDVLPVLVGLLLFFVVPVGLVALGVALFVSGERAPKRARQRITRDKAFSRDLPPDLEALLKTHIGQDASVTGMSVAPEILEAEAEAAMVEFAEHLSPGEVPLCYRSKSILVTDQRICYRGWDHSVEVFVNRNVPVRAIKTVTVVVADRSPSSMLWVNDEETTIEGSTEDVRRIAQLLRHISALEARGQKCPRCGSTDIVVHAESRHKHKIMRSVGHFMKSMAIGALVGEALGLGHGGAAGVGYSVWKGKQADDGVDLTVECCDCHEKPQGLTST